MNNSNNHVVIICHDFGSINGGAAKVAIQSAIGLSNRGYEVVFFCGVGPIDDTLYNSVKEVICLEQKDILSNPNRIRAAINGLWNKKAYTTMTMLLEKYDNAIVHIHGWSKSLTASIVKACHQKGVKPFISIHDYFAACPNGGFYNYKTEQICEYLGASLQCMLCNCDKKNYTQKLWRYIRQKLQDNHIRYSSNIIYIATSRFSYNAIRRSLASKEVRWVENPINIYSGSKVRCYDNQYFLFVGRLSQEKGADLFCQAIRSINAKGIVVGAGENFDVYSKEYPEIEFVGWKTSQQMHEYINRSRALVVPSRYYEGSPLIVPEMQCYGLPCIVPDRCAARESVEDGINVLIFK